MFREENDIIVVTDELDEIKKFLVRKGYTVDPSNTEDTAHQLVMNVQKTMDYNDDDGEYKNLGTIKIKIVFDDNESSGGTKKRIIKRKKTTRRKRKTRK